MRKILERLEDDGVFSVSLQSDKKKVEITEEYEACHSTVLDYREFGELIKELEAIRRQMILMPPDDLSDDPNLYTTGADY